MLALYLVNTVELLSSSTGRIKLKTRASVVGGQRQQPSLTLISPLRLKEHHHLDSMAHNKSCLMIILLASFVSCISATLLCEDLPIDLCAFALSSMGSRCVLEEMISTNGDIEYECQTSQVNAAEFAEWVETDDCVRSCGINRLTVGISSDALVERGFIKSLCSMDCQSGCPNVVDLFDKLAAGEGVLLSHVCEAQAGTMRREMGEVTRSGFASLSADTFHSWEASSVALSPTVSQGLVSTSPVEAPSSL